MDQHHHETDNENESDNEEIQSYIPIELEMN
jgi:hypothetical protein